LYIVFWSTFGCKRARVYGIGLTSSFLALPSVTLWTGVTDGDRGLGRSIHGIAQGQGVTLSALDGTLAGDKDRPGSRAAPCVHIGIPLIAIVTAEFLVEHTRVN